MQPMTKEQAREFVERWRLIEHQLLAEIRNTTPEMKAKQIAAAYQAGRTLALTPDPMPFEEWQRLREKLNDR